MKAKPRSAACRFASSLGLIGLLLGAPAWAVPAGEVAHVSGALILRKADGSSKILAPQSKVEAGDLLATAGDTYARVKFTDGVISVTNKGGQQLFSAGHFGFAQNFDTQPNRVPPERGVSNNTPGFGGGPASGSKAECVVQ